MLRRNVLRMLKLQRGKNSRPSTMFLIGICMPMNAAVRSALLARHRDCPKEADRDPDWPRQLAKVRARPRINRSLRIAVSEDKLAYRVVAQKLMPRPGEDPTGTPAISARLLSQVGTGGSNAAEAIASMFLQLVGRVKGPRPLSGLGPSSGPHLINVRL